MAHWHKLAALAALVALIATPAQAQQTVTQVRASPATFTAGTTAPLQSDTNGNLRVVASGTSAVSGTVAIDQTTPGTTNGIAVKQIGSTTVATGNGVVGTGVQRVSIASDNTGFSVNPTGVYNSTSPTFTNGQRGDLQLGPRGRVLSGTGGSINGTDAWTNTLFGWAADDDSVTAARAGLVAGLVFNGATWDRTRGDVNGQALMKGLSATRWSYTSGASPILSNTTTAVTIKTAAGVGIKNVVDSCQLTTTAFGASVPLAIRDGAGGTVRWALTVPTAGFLQPVPIVFEQPFVTTANTLLEVVTTTANTSGTVTLNCQGHTET